MRVLYVHHCGAFGGASRSLLELVRALPRDRVRPCLLTQRGTVAPYFREIGVDVIEVAGISQFDNTRYGHYRGLRWLILLREAAFLLPTFLGLWRARKQWPDIAAVHVNEVTNLPALLLARWLFRKPVVVHVRSLQSRTTPRRTRLIWSLVRRFAEAVVAIDRNVESTLPAQVPVSLVHNAFDPAASSGADAGPIASLPVPAGALKAAFVGNLLPEKGVYEFLDAARICHERGVDAHFIFVGGNLRQVRGVKGALLRAFGFAHDVQAEIARRIGAYELGSRVHMVPFTPHIAAVYSSVDVLCFPSHLDAPGRPVFEAAFLGVPSIVAAQAPTADTLVPGETGLTIPARDPAALADAIIMLASDRQLLAKLGRGARELALRNFDVTKNAGKMLNIYNRLVSA